MSDQHLSDPQPDASESPRASEPANDSDTAQPMSASRRRMFRLVALLLPLLVLIALEVVLRLAGYGGHPPMLADIGAVDGKHIIMTTPEAMRPFFVADPDRRGSIETQFFAMPKDAGTVRIFIVGGSAAQGYPEPRHLKLSAFLEMMLHDAWPDRNVEVINLGATAIASFPASQMALAALEYDPDLLIVYSGNNEFYGACGVASTHQLGRSALAMQTLYHLRGTAIAQFLKRPPAPRDPDASNDEGLMDNVLADAQIPPDDDRRAAAARNLTSNIARMIAAYNRANIPVIVCTCPGSERNLAPIGEDLSPPLNAEKTRQFAKLLESAKANLSFKPADAMAELVEAAKLYDQHATLQYLRARCLDAMGKPQEAADAYALARDLDTMPWRTPSTSNAAIRQTATRGALLCDLEKVFQDASPGGSIGWELMDDHVHPSRAGQVLIARTLVKAMEELPGDLHVESAAIDQLPSDDAYLTEAGANDLDTYRVVYRVIDLFERSFFKRSNPQALLKFEGLRRQSERAMDATTLSAVKNLQSAGMQVPITGWVGEAQFKNARFKQAAQNFTYARAALPKHTFLRIRYGCLEDMAQLRDKQTPGKGLMDDLAADCAVMHALTDHTPPVLDAYCGYANARTGGAQKAVDLIEPVYRDLQDDFKSELIEGIVLGVSAKLGMSKGDALLKSLGMSREDLSSDARHLLDVIPKIDD
jgi:lysophospholipase L1-like esterase